MTLAYQNKMMNIITIKVIKNKKKVIMIKRLKIKDSKVLSNYRKTKVCRVLTLR